MENRWIGKGHQGEAFRDPKHLYADDLDLLGPGSAFELLSTSRTATGDRMLAEWLLAPAPPEIVQARQAAVTELRERLDLREDIALMGEDIRTAIDDQAMKTWGESPAVHFFPGARWVALALACAAVATFVLFLSQVLSLRPFLAVVLAELIFGLGSSRQCSPRLNASLHARPRTETGSPLARAFRKRTLRICSASSS